MTNNSVRVRVRFFDAPEGGRKNPFSGPRYAPIVRLHGKDWSVVIRFEGPTVNGWVSGWLSYLMVEGPSLLHGTRLELFEGPNVVGEAIVAFEAGDL